MSAFRTVVVDVDSTLCGIEGIDWLAERRSARVAADVSRLTRLAMEGDITLESVYEQRLALVAPTRGDVTALADAYAGSLAPGAAAVIAELIRRGTDVHLISGGLLPAIRPVAALAGIADKKIHAVEIYFDDAGKYSSFDGASPLTRQFGKRDLIASLALAAPTLMVGDGMTDAEVRPAVDAFAAFTGFVRRESVVGRADHVLAHFGDLLTIGAQ